jgi:hypothetical protein
MTDQQEIAALKCLVEMQTITIEAQKQLIAAQKVVLEAALGRLGLQEEKPAEKPMLRLVE